MRKKFIYNTLVDEENLCNMVHEKMFVSKTLDNHGKLVIYGRRDSGKTSLIKNVIQPLWHKKNPSGFFLYIELFGITTLREMSERFTLYFNKAYGKSFPIKDAVSSLFSTLKGIRPTISMESNGTPSVSFSTGSGEDNIIDFRKILENVQAIFDTGIPSAIVIDEFQDVASVPQAEALLRESLQNLRFDIPIILMGSKRHLLTKIFQKPNAPFFNWGDRLDIQYIKFEEYNPYILERWDGILSASDDTLVYLQKTLNRNPEAINMLSAHILGHYMDKKKELEEFQEGRDKIFTVSPPDIDGFIRELVERRQSEFDNYLQLYTMKERSFLTYLAKRGIIPHPYSKEVSQKLNISIQGLRGIIEKLLDNADIYKEDEGFVLSKPLLMHYLRSFRL
ncbi:MAG: AAA family ATPase [Oligoflexales bacterium]|nr:AAA family ATPase [Oligoflexales bacterium]